MNAFAVVSDSGTLPEESSFFISVGHPFPAICIRTSTERPEAIDKACFFIAGIDPDSLLQAVECAVDMMVNRDYGIPVPDYVDENVSIKVVKIIQHIRGLSTRWFGENSDMKILVTGANGFVGKNLCAELKNIRDGKARCWGDIVVNEVFEYDMDSTLEELDVWCRQCDFVFNLAGVNRPQSQDEFMAAISGFASTLLDVTQKA